MEEAYFGLAHAGGGPEGTDCPMDLLNALVQGLLLGGLYALFAAGLSIMFGVMRIVNLAHGDLAVVAAYLVLVLLGGTMFPLWLVVLVILPLFAMIGYGFHRSLFSRSLSRPAHSPPCW